MAHPAGNPFLQFLRKPINWFLLFIPLTVLLEHLHGMPAPVLFFSAAVTIVPIAALIVASTAQLSTRTGDAIGGLLNATFGNAPELIIALVALKAGLLDMVRASLAGAILANLLMALGMGFLLGGLRFHEQRFNPAATRAYSTMMFVAAVSMTVPSAYSRAFGTTSGPIRSRGPELRAFHPRTRGFARWRAAGPPSATPPWSSPRFSSAACRSAALRSLRPD